MGRLTLSICKQHRYVALSYWCSVSICNLGLLVKGVVLPGSIELRTVISYAKFIFLSPSKIQQRSSIIIILSYGCIIIGIIFCFWDTFSLLDIKINFV